MEKFGSLGDLLGALPGGIDIGILSEPFHQGMRYLAKYAGPILVIRAGKDQVIPAANTARLIAALPKPPQIVDFPNADHNTIGADSGYGKALSAFAAVPPSP